MAVSFTNYSWWTWPSKEKDKASNKGISNLTLNSASEFSVRELENVKFCSVNGRMSSSRKVKRK